MITSATIRITGYVGKDPISPSANHPNFITFSASVITPDKNKEKITTWYECQTSDEKIAKLIRDEVRKGKGVTVEGTPTLGAYIDKNGKAVPTCKIYISRYRDLLVFTPNAKQTETANDIMYPKIDDNYDIDDSIPF